MFLPRSERYSAGSLRGSSNIDSQSTWPRQHFLNFFPERQGQGLLGGIFIAGDPCSAEGYVSLRLIALELSRGAREGTQPTASRRGRLQLHIRPCVCDYGRPRSSRSSAVTLVMR